MYRRGGVQWLTLSVQCASPWDRLRSTTIPACRSVSRQLSHSAQPGSVPWGDVTAQRSTCKARFAAGRGCNPPTPLVEGLDRSLERGHALCGLTRSLQAAASGLQQLRCQDA